MATTIPDRADPPSAHAQPPDHAHARGPKRARPASAKQARLEAFSWTGIILVAAALLISFVLGRGPADKALVQALSGTLGGSGPFMAAAGWLTVAFLPFSIASLVTGHRKRHPRTVEVYRPQPSPDPDVTQLITRIRADNGHRIARPPRRYWLPRIPMLAAIVLGAWFWPVRGASLGQPWRATSAGIAFNDGWRISLVAAALGVLLVLAEPWISAWAHRDLVRPGTLAIAAAGLAATLAVVAT